MKNLFLAILAILIFFSQAVMHRKGTLRTEAGVPVLYWAAGADPARLKTMAMFRQWLKDKGYPDMEVRLDPNNAGLSKVIVQATSGVGPDLIGAFSWDFQYLDQIGLLEDLGSLMKGMPLPTPDHDPQVAGDLHRDGKRLGYSVNVGTSLYIANKAAFTSLGIALPPARWSLDEFETLGKAWVAAANAANPRPRRFYADRFDRETLRRSLGVSFFNETMTACTLDTPEHRALLARLVRWIRQDRLFPSAADMEGMVQAASGDAANWGGGTSLFHRGAWAMTFNARHILPNLREWKPLLDLSVHETPNGGFPNCITRTWAVGVSRDGRHKDLARYFLLFLTSDVHNRWMTDAVSQMPPLPAFRRDEAYRHPAAWTNEWNLHAPFSERFEQIGIGSEYCPFVNYTAYTALERRGWDAVMSGVLSVEQMTAEVTEKINEEIRKSLRRDKRLVPRYQEALARQKQISALKASGKPIPLRLIDNPFLARYLRDTGKAAFQTP